MGNFSSLITDVEKEYKQKINEINPYLNNPDTTFPIYIAVSNNDESNLRIIDELKTRGHDVIWTSDKKYFTIYMRNYHEYYVKTNDDKFPRTYTNTVTRRNRADNKT